MSTLGTNVLKETIRVRNPATGAEEDVQLVLWDIMGEPTIRDLLREAFFSGAAGLLAVCNVTRPETAKALGDLVPTLSGAAKLWRSVPGRFPGWPRCPFSPFSSVVF